MKLVAVSACQRVSVSIGLLLFVSALATGCHRPVSADPVTEPAEPPWFADVTEQIGLHFRHDAGPEGSYFMPQIMGSGAALFDYNNDGRLDIYLIQNGGPKSRSKNRLFRQEPDGRFTDVSEGSGLDIAGYGMGVAIGDVNNDGWPDVLVTEYGGARLFLNNGNGTFTDITQEAGIDNIHWGTSACFVDYDRDGWLDLVIVNYVEDDPSRPCTDAAGKRDYCAPGGFLGSVTKLYRNLGPTAGTKENRVRFEDVTLKSGLGLVPGPGLGVVCADFDGDHWPDIFIANDAQPNRLWINQRNGTFKEEAVLRGVAYNSSGLPQGNMGIALGDVDGDGLFDLFVTHLTEEANTLWRQGPPGMFRDWTVAAGLESPRWRGTGFGTVFADFDQDGALDLALVNGRVSRVKLTSPDAQTAAALGDFWSQYAEHNQLFVNDGEGHFRNISAHNAPFCGAPTIARGLACGDLNGDGALDLLVTTVNGPARVYRNVVPNRGHWLLIRVVDPALRRDAYGAEITLQAGRRRWVRWVNPAYSYLCSNDPRAHFGLGHAERVDAIQVVWPDGTVEAFPGQKVDQCLVLRKGQGRRQSGN